MVKKKHTRTIAWLLSLTLIISMLSMGTFVASAAETDTVESSAGGATAVLNNAANWSSCYVYYWGNGGSINNGAWPGVKLTDADKNAEGYYEVSIPETHLAGENGVIFNSGSAQSADLSIASGESKVYNNADKSWKDYDSNSLKLSFTTDVASPQYDGTSVTITATSSGAVGTSTYTFKANNSTIYTGTNNTCTWTPTSSGTYTLSVSVADTAGNSNEKTQTFEIKDSSNVAEPVLKGVKIGSNGYGVVNNSTPVRVEAAGGKTGTNLLFYKVAITDPNGNAVNTVYYTQRNTLNFTPTRTGNYKATVSVQNSYNKTETRTFDVPVKQNGEIPTEEPTQEPTSPTLSMTSFTLSSSSVTVGTPVTLTAKVNGGKANYTYTFKSGNNTIKTVTTSNKTASYSWTPTSAGTYTMQAVVKDANGQSVSKTATLTVKAATSALSISSFTVSKTTITQGETVTLTGKVSGGKANYNYRFKGNGNLIYDTTTANTTVTKTWKPSKTGTYTLELAVTDANGKTVSKTITLTVKASSALGISAFTVSKTTITQGETVTLTGKVSGGKANYNYRFKGNGNLIYDTTTSNTTVTKTWKPSKTGTYTLDLVVKDANGNTVSKTITLTVKAATSTLSISSFTVSKTTITQGETVTLTGKVSGGKANYNYRFKGNGNLIYDTTTSNTTVTKSWKPSKTGTYTLDLVVKDANGKTVSKTITLTVKAATSTLSSSFTVSKTTITQGETVTLTGKVSGGKANYNYRFKGNGNLIYDTTTSNTTVTKTWKPSKTGTYTLDLVVKDANGNTVSKIITLTVKAATSTLSISSFTVSKTTIAQGETVTLTGKVSGGKANYNYRFKGNGNLIYDTTTSNTTVTKTWKPSKTGTYTLELVVTDANGNTVSKKVNLVVSSTGYIKGDVNGDGKVTVEDANYIIFYLSGTSGYTITKGTDKFLAADMDNDGVITMNDSTLIINMC